MKTMFCIKCGKEAVKDCLCKQHFLEKNELVSIKNVEIRYCKECGSFHNNKVKINKVKDAIDFLFNDASNTSKDADIEKKDFSWKEVGNKIYVNCEIIGRIKNIEKNEEKKFLINVRKYMCDNCIKLAGGYYEALIQIRGENKEKILKKIKFLVPNDNITVISETKNGYDIKIIKKSFAKTAAKQLKDDGFEVITSYKHAATKKGKMLYRNYYAIR